MYPKNPQFRMRYELQLPLTYYTAVQRHWPKFGNHILAVYDSDTMIVYVSLHRSLARIAMATQSFLESSYQNHLMRGKCSSFNLHTNFLSAMAESGWASRDGRDTVLALTIYRRGFEELLQGAIAGLEDEVNPDPDVEFEWKYELSPEGEELDRGRLVLMVKNEMLRRLTHMWIIKIQDVTLFVRDMRAKVILNPKGLLVPDERVYSFNDPGIPPKIQLDQISNHKLQDDGKHPRFPLHP